MKIIHRDKESVKLQVQSMDDLWYLSQIVEPGDGISGRTERKVKIGDSCEGKTASVKKTFFVAISAEKLEFHKYSNNLRINGKVTQGPEDIPLGSYHTFDIEPGSIIEINKIEWPKFQLDRLKDASREEQPKILIVVFDREEAYFSVLRSYGYDVLSEFKGDVEKKDVPEKAKGNFYEEIASQIEAYDARYQFNRIVLASPAFWKEYLLKELKEELAKKAVLATCNTVGRSGINEVLARPEVMTALKDDRTVKELALVDDLFAEINKSALGAYGLDETENAASAGACKALLITDSLIRKSREDGTYKRVEQMMKNAESARCTVTIISSDHDGGKRLDGLGGVGALLRYKL